MEKFEQGARVVFFGDSITANGTWMRRILEYYRKNTDVRFEIYNAGVAGDNATNGYNRIRDALLYRNPTDVVVMFGMNDVGRGYYKEGATYDVVAERRACIETCIMKVKQIVAFLRNRGIRVILASPTPYDEFSEIPEYNFQGVEAALYEIGDRLSVYAKAAGIPFVAFNSTMLPLLKKAYRDGKSFIGPDRVHPTAQGHELMAAIFLKEQGFDVKIPETVEEMTALSRRPFDEWEEKRYTLERRLTLPMYIDRCCFSGVKDASDVLKYARDMLNEEPSPYVKSTIEAYNDFVLKKDELIKEHLEHIKTVYDN